VGSVTQQAANGDAWAFAVVAIIAVTVLLGLLIWRRTTNQDVVLDPSCPTSGGCPEIQVLVNEVRHLTDQLKEDREERREHRRKVEEDVVRIHARINDQDSKFAWQKEVDALKEMFRHYTDEAERIVGLLRSRLSE
jgi:hypothetical protein